MYVYELRPLSAGTVRVWGREEVAKRQRAVQRAGELDHAHSGASLSQVSHDSSYCPKRNVVCETSKYRMCGMSCDRECVLVY